jgi:hypothetical protein
VIHTQTTTTSTATTTATTTTNHAAAAAAAAAAAKKKEESSESSGLPGWAWALIGAAIAAILFFVVRAVIQRRKGDGGSTRSQTPEN